MKKFNSSFSTGMLVSTIVVMVLLLWAIYTMAVRLLSLPEVNTSYWILAFSIGFIVFAIVFSFLLQIVKVELTDNDLIIKKVWGTINIPIKDIVCAKKKNNIWRDIRVFGIRGFFGYIGLFWNSLIGTYKAYVRDGNSMIQIKTKDQTYVISCDDHTQLITLLQSHMG